VYSVPMRDIREDLRERLDAFAAQRVELERQLAEVQTQETSYKVALRQEEQRIRDLTDSRGASLFPTSAPAMNSDAATSSPALTFVILNAMVSKRRPLALDEIKDAISNSFDFGEKAPGRSIHFGLVGLQRAGEVDRLPDGRWTIAEVPKNGVSTQEKTQ
jgi:hypothetical protein